MKYKLTENTKIQDGITLHQIQALRSFGLIEEGDLGGWIEKESNLSQAGDCWVSGNALVSGDAQVYGDARVFGGARVYGNAKVLGNAWVYGNAKVSEGAQAHGDAHIYGNAQVLGNARVFGNARLCAKASFTKGWFIGGGDSEKITNITDQTGPTCWKAQYVLGDHEITPIEEIPKVENSLSGQEVEVKIGDKIYKAIIQ